MDSALVIPPKDFKELQERIITASEFQSLIEHHPDILENVSLSHQENGAPVVFRQSHTKNGNTQQIKACFAYASGYASEEDHIFKPSRGYRNLEDAVKNNAKILLSLNIDLSHLSLDFSSASDPNIQSEAKWKAANSNYYVVSVKELSVALKAIKAMAAEGADMKKDVVAMYRGAILPYQDFYLGKREEDIMQLYHDMKQGRSGITIGNTRNIGFPRIFRLVAAQTTIKEDATRGIKGNLISRKDLGIFSQLVFPHQNALDKRRSARNAWEVMRQNNGEIYVIASPSITIDRTSKQYLHQMRWVVTSDVAQIASIQNKSRLETTASRFSQKLNAA